LGCTTVSAVDTMVATDLDVCFVLDLMADASMPTPAAARFIAFVHRFPEHADAASRVWYRHFGSPVYTEYGDKPVGAW